MKRSREDQDQEQTFQKRNRYSNEAVAQHYNARPDVGVVKRKESTIIRLRSFNNWVKSVLIQRHVRPRQCVLDMGCGKGGDLLKWAKAKIQHLVAADIAEVSMQQMQGRYQSLRDRRFTAEFYPMDCYSVNSRKKLSFKSCNNIWYRSFWNPSCSRISNLIQSLCNSVFIMLLKMKPRHVQC